MIKGKATIELTNEKTGEKQVIVEENIVTNYFKDLFKYEYPLSRFFVSNWTFNNINLIYKGIMCFEDVNEEDAEKYDFPVWNNVTASGNHLVSYDTNDAHNGIYNNNLSTSTQHSRTYVWDWDADHGNGKISSISLVPFKCAGGNFPHMGGGTILADNNYNSIDLYRSCNNNTYPYIEQANSWHFKLKDDGVSIVIYANYFDFENKKVYICTNASTDNRKLYWRVAIFDLNQNTVNPFDMWLHNNEVYYHNAEYKYYDSGKSFTGNAYYSCYSVKDHYIYNLLNISDIGNGKVLNLNRFDMISGEYKQINLTNRTDGTWRLAGQNSYVSAYDGGAFNFADGYVFFKSTNRKLYAVNIDDDTDWHTVKKSDGTDFLFREGNNAESVFAPINNRLYIADVYSSSYDTSRYEHNTYMIDTKNFTARQTTMPGLCKISKYGLSSKVQGQSNCVLSKTSGLRNFYPVNGYNGTNNTDLYIGFNIDPVVLSTINNLQTPVVKTSDMSMRITYTISDGTEE